MQFSISWLKKRLYIYSTKHVVKSDGVRKVAIVFIFSFGLLIWLIFLRKFATRGSNTDTEFRYSGIELNTVLWCWKWANSGILKAKNSLFWPNFGGILL